MIDPDQEITAPAPRETLDQIAKQWLLDIASSERPTVNIRPIKKDSK